MFACCSVLQCVAVCCSVLQCVAVSGSVTKELTCYGHVFLYQQKVDVKFALNNAVLVEKAVDLRIFTLRISHKSDLAVKSI